MEELQCLVCAEPCRFFGVFDCSHGVCGVCAIRMYTITKKGCPVCRHESKELIVTREPPVQGEYTFDIKGLKHRKSAMVSNRAFGVRVDGDELNSYVDKLHQYVCPMPECWSNGVQDPFRLKEGLREHLNTVHKVDYCSICLDNRPVYLSEQQTYSDKERDSHNRGECLRDPDSFVGHPMCFFCNRRHYDGEHLLKHLQQQHYSCDLCNRGEYTFTFYKNRPKLLEHFADKHKLCDHPACRDLDPMLRVYHSDFELQTHMQSAHGASSKEISLEALGFRFGTSATSASAPSTNTTAARSGPVQTGANVVATFVKFDHIHRMDRIELEPTGRRNAGGKGGRGGKKPLSSGASNPDPLPAHYLTSNQQFKPILANVTAEDPKGRSDSNTNDTNTVLQGKKRSEVKTSERPAEHAARVNRHDVDALRTLPSGMEERKRLFGEVINRLLGKGSQKHTQFLRALEDYRSGRIFATEFYKYIAQVIPDENELFEAFPLVAAVIDDPTKQSSLFTAKSMLSCVEFQNQEKNKQEEEKKASEERAIAELRAKRVAVGGNKKPAKNAWSAGSGAPATPPMTSPVSKGPTKPQGIWAQTANNSAASAAVAVANAPSLPTASNAFMDPADFPALASGPQRRWPTNAGSQKAGAGSKTNAWFGKKK